MTAWLPDVVPDTAIASSWGNTIRDRTVTPFATAAARLAAIPTPKPGQLSWLMDKSRLDIYDGTAGAWRALPAGDLGFAQLTASSATFPLSVGTVVAGLSVAVPANKLPAGRIVEVSLVGIIDVTGATNAASAIRVNATQIAQVNIGMFASGNSSIHGKARYVATGVAATFDVSSWQSASAGARFIATATYPTMLQVTDIGAV